RRSELLTTRTQRTDRRARDPDPLRGQGPLPLGQDPRRFSTYLGAQTSRERKLQIASASIAAIHATAQITYAAGGGSAAKNGFAATAGPTCCCAAMTIEGSRLQTAPRQSPSVGRMSFVRVPTFVMVALWNAAPTPPTIPPIHAMPNRIRSEERRVGKECRSRGSAD